MIAIGENEIGSLLHTGSDIAEVYLGETRCWPDHNLILVLKPGSMVPQLWEQSGQYNEAWPQEYDSASRRLMATIPDESDATINLFKGMSIERVEDFPKLTSCDMIYSIFRGTEISDVELDKIIRKFPKTVTLFGTLYDIAAQHLILHSWPTTETTIATAAFQSGYTSGSQIFRAITFKTGCVFPKDLYVYRMFAGNPLQLIDFKECDMSKIEDCKGMFKDLKMCPVSEMINEIDKSHRKENDNLFTLIELPSDQTLRLRPINGTDMFAGSEGFEIDNPSLLDFSRLKVADNMFANCRSYSQLDLTSLNENNLESFKGMFQNNLAIIRCKQSTRSWMSENAETLCGDKDFMNALLSNVEVVD